MGVPSFRPLNDDEKRIAYSVFQDTLPYDSIFLANMVGAFGEPFTVPSDDEDAYVLFVGAHYKDMSTSAAGRELLIHELTHVWQGEHSSSRWTYIGNSVYNRVKEWVGGPDSYAYDATKLKKWWEYTAEQQASIVEHWYAKGMSTTDVRYPFIQYWIRRDLNVADPPKPKLARVKVEGRENSRMIPSDVLFSFNSAELRPEAARQLDRAAQSLIVWATGRTVVIEGHTDSTGSHGYNMRLSEARANAVKKALVALGVPDAHNFKIKGYGETRPIAPNNTRQGRTKNRRVEFRYE